MTFLRYSYHNNGKGGTTATTTTTTTRRAATSSGRHSKTWISTSRSNKGHQHSVTRTTIPPFTNMNPTTTVALKKKHFHWNREQPSHLPVVRSSIHSSSRSTSWRRPKSQDEENQVGTAMAAPTVHEVPAECLLPEHHDDQIVSEHTGVYHHDDSTLNQEYLDDTASSQQELSQFEVVTQESSTFEEEPKRPPSPISIVDSQSLAPLVEPLPATMTKRGANQLVRQDLDTHASSAAQQEGLVPVLRKVGPNKLVHTDHHHHHIHHPTIRNKAPPSIPSLTVPAKRKLTYSSRRGKLSRAPSTSAPAVKRVKLSEPTTSTSSDSSSGKIDPGTNGEKLTDFAYRETCTVSGRVRGERDHHQVRRNMGLVRVLPDQSKTPICPTFLQGVACTNPSCTKRHDVSKEAATPICFFFQRQGQCGKGPDCPFRHIKVNPRAVVCPSFNLLGFCQNEDCLMKHVRTKTTNRSLIPTTTTNHTK